MTGLTLQKGIHDSFAAEREKIEVPIIPIRAGTQDVLPTVCIAKYITQYFSFIVDKLTFEKLKSGYRKKRIDTTK